MTDDTIKWLYTNGMSAYEAAAKCKKLIEVLNKIVSLDPHVDSENGWNEWGEADCFEIAQQIAIKSLEEFNNGHQ